MTFFSCIYTWPEILRSVYIIQGSCTLLRIHFKNSPSIRYEHFPTQLSLIIAFPALNPRCLCDIFLPGEFRAICVFPHFISPHACFPTHRTWHKCFPALWQFWHWVRMLSCGWHWELLGAYVFV